MRIEERQTSRAAIRWACQIVGSQRRLAKRLGVTQQTVNQWCNGETVPPGRCEAISEATGGRIRTEQLRPDVFANDTAA